MKKKKEFDSNLVYIKNYLRTKVKFQKGKSTQIFIIIKFQKKLLNIYAYQ